MSPLNLMQSTSIMMPNTNEQTLRTYLERILGNNNSIDSQAPTASGSTQEARNVSNRPSTSCNPPSTSKQGSCVRVTATIKNNRLQATFSTASASDLTRTNE